MKSILVGATVLLSVSAFFFRTELTIAEVALNFLKRFTKSQP